jgi:trigger factor
MAKKEKKGKKEQPDLTKSKAKREERKKELAEKKRKQLMWRIIWIIVAAVIVAVIAINIGKSVYLAAIRTTSSDDMGACLTDDGKIEGVTISDVLTLVDYANISIPAEEVAATDEEVDEDINSTLESNQYASDDTSLEITDGDTVNIDYVGTIDGEEFDGGNSDGEGYDLTIGSGTFIDDFEEQLIGYHPGDEVTVEVTFPDDYSTEELAGQDAVFAVTINSITVTPELTDEFVAENLDIEGVTTASEYRDYIANIYYEEHLEDYLTDYIIENSTVKSYPKAYLKAMKAVTKYNDEYMLSYYNQMFSSYGITAYEDLWDLRGEDITDELSYEKELTTRAQESVKSALVYQGIFEDAGLSIDVDNLLSEMNEEYGEDYAQSMLDTYGQGYMVQAEIINVVTDYLMDLYK